MSAFSKPSYDAYSGFSSTTYDGTNQPMFPMIPSSPPSTTVPAFSMYWDRSFACPDGQTSRVASTSPAAIAGNCADSLNSSSSTVQPISFSITYCATTAFASAPIHGLTAITIGSSLLHCATLAVSPPAVSPPSSPSSTSPQAAPTSASPATHATNASHLEPFMRPPSVGAAAAAASPWPSRSLRPVR